MSNDLSMTIEDMSFYNSEAFHRFLIAIILVLIIGITVVMLLRYHSFFNKLFRVLIGIAISPIIFILEIVLFFIVTLASCIQFCWNFGKEKKKTEEESEYRDVE